MHNLIDYNSYTLWLLKILEVIKHEKTLKNYAF